MHKSQHVFLVVAFFSNLGRFEKIRIIESSSLNDRDQSILTYRFVNGFTIQESATKLGMEANAFVKAQRKAIERFYTYNFPVQL